MPPSPTQQTADTGHMLQEHNKSSGGLPAQAGMGAWVGIFIIIILLGFGALYFWGAYLAEQSKHQQQVPLIQGDVEIQ